MNLETFVTRVLKRLGDAEGEVWSREEIRIYGQDGYDQMCRSTKCLWDVAYVENLPAVANYSSEEEAELAKQIPNLILTGRRTFTLEIEKGLAPAGSVGPAGVSTHAELALLSSILPTVPKPNPTGQLPRNYVGIERVTHDQLSLYPEFNAGLARNWDNHYEIMSGRPNWFTVDKDGLFTLRRYPGGDGAAVYPDVTGWWGVEVSDTAYTGSIVSEEAGLPGTAVWGSLVYDPEEFPMGGPWGSPTRTHPDADNTRVEITRLGRDLSEHEFEIPSSHVKYIEFWAASRALRRDGPGQDLKLSKHYSDRFDMGLDRITKRLRGVESERSGRIGYGPQRGSVPPLQITLPYNYGRRTRRGGY